MSVAIAIREGDSIFLGTDSQGTSGGERIHCTISKIHTINDKEWGIALGPTLGPHLVYYSILEDCIADNGENWPSVFAANMLCAEPGSRECAIKELDDKEEGGGSIVVGHGKMWLIDTNGHVFEPGEGTIAVGTGSEYALGAAFALQGKGISVENRIIRAIEAACYYNVYCGPPIHITEFKWTGS